MSEEKIKKDKFNGTIIMPIIFIILSIIYVTEAIRMSPPIEQGEISFTFFPLVIGILFFILNIMSLNKGLKDLNKEIKGEKYLVFQWQSIKKFIVAVALIGIYVCIFKPIGYFISSILLVFGLMLVFKDKNQNNVKLLIFSIVITILIYYFYEKMFGVRLPYGGGL